MNKPSEYVTDLFHKLRDDISWLKHKLFTDKPKLESAESPRHYTINAIHKDIDSDQEDDKSIQATLILPPAIRVYAETEERPKKWLQDRTVLIQIGGIFLAIVAAIIYYCQLNAMLNANKLANKTFEVGQRSYVTLGRKDGVVAEFRNTHGATKDGLVIYFQNSGHIPARLNWGLHNWFASDGRSSSLTQYVPMSRSKNKKTGDVTENSSTDSGNIGVDSVREAAITYFDQSFVDSLIKNNSIFQLNGVYEYCDEMGTYSCKEFQLAYQHLPFDSFRVARENYCIEGAYQPKLGPDDEPLPLCSNKGVPSFSETSNR
jgi:hypothetical protein